MIYKWAAGSHIKIDAQSAGEQIERLQKAHGGKLKPKNVVEEARDESSPLHGAFEWSDGIAAEKYRQHQASVLLCSLVTVVVNVSRPSQEPQYVRAYVNVREPEDLKDKTYRSLATVMNDEQLREQMLEAALDEFRTWRERHRRFAELTEIFEAGDLVIGRLPRAKAKAAA